MKASIFLRLLSVWVVICIIYYSTKEHHQSGKLKFLNICCEVNIRNECRVAFDCGNGSHKRINFVQAFPKFSAIQWNVSQSVGIESKLCRLWLQTPSVEEWTRTLQERSTHSFPLRRRERCTDQRWNRPDSWKVPEVRCENPLQRRNILFSLWRIFGVNVNMLKIVSQWIMSQLAYLIKIPTC